MTASTRSRIDGDRRIVRQKLSQHLACAVKRLGGEAKPHGVKWLSSSELAAGVAAHYVTVTASVDDTEARNESTIFRDLPTRPKAYLRYRCAPNTVHGPSQYTYS